MVKNCEQCNKHQPTHIHNHVTKIYCDLNQARNHVYKGKITVSKPTKLPQNITWASECAPDSNNILILLKSFNISQI